MKHSFVLAITLLLCLTASGQSLRPFVDKGYAGDVGFAILVQPYVYGAVSSVHGYSFGRGWFLGAGGAFEFGFSDKKREVSHLMVDAYPTYPSYDGGRIVRLFVDFRKTFSIGKVSLFADVRYGLASRLTNPRFSWIFSPDISAGMMFLSHFCISAGVSGRYVEYHEGGCSYRMVHLLKPVVSLSYAF